MQDGSLVVGGEKIVDRPAKNADDPSIIKEINKIEAELDGLRSKLFSVDGHSLSPSNAEFYTQARRLMFEAASKLANIK